MAKKKTLNDLVDEIRAMLPEGTSLIIGKDRVLTLDGGSPAAEDIDLGPPAEEEPAAEEPAAEGGDTWQPGEKCQVMIDGSLYPGEVKEVNEDEETCFVVFEDGDEGWYPALEVETLGSTEEAAEGGDVDKGDFDLSSLGLPKKIQEKLEAQGYANVKEVEDALADGTLAELKVVPAAALKQVEKAIKTFTGK